MNESFFGRILEPKEVFEQGDKYGSPNGWKPIPSVFVGALVPKDCSVTFVRPTRQCTVGTPAKHDQATEVFTDPDFGFKFKRTICFTCKAHIGDVPIPA